MFICFVKSRCFRVKVEEHRDVRIFFNEEPKRHSISTSFTESDKSLVDCFCHSVPYLGYWLVGNCFKPGEVFIRRYDPGKYFVMAICLLFVLLYTNWSYDISYILLGEVLEWTEFGIQGIKFIISRIRFGPALLLTICELWIGYKIIFRFCWEQEDSNCLLPQESPNQPCEREGSDRISTRMEC